MLIAVRLWTSHRQQLLHCATNMVHRARQQTDEAPTRAIQWEVAEGHVHLTLLITLLTRQGNFARFKIASSPIMAPVLPGM